MQVKTFLAPLNLTAPPKNACSGSATVSNISFCKIQQNFTVWSGVKTLELHQLFNDVARNFAYTQAWVTEGAQEFEIFSKKAVFLVVSGKNQISPLLAAPRKTFGKIHWWPSWKKSFRRPCTQACKITPIL